MVIIKDNKKVTGTLSSIKDAKGADAQVEAGSVKVTSSDEGVITVQQNAENEKEYTVSAVAPGTAKVIVSADADLGEGVTTITKEDEFTVTAGDAVEMGTTYSEPVDQ